MTRQEFAVAMWAKGCWIIPSKDKIPSTHYAHFRSIAPSVEQIEEMWTRWGDANECTAITGSGGLCCIDIDLKNDPTGTVVKRFENEFKQEHPGLFEELYIEQGKSGGRHYWFRFPDAPMSETLAYMLEELDFEREFAGEVAKYKPVIEIMGLNKQCRIAPSEGILPIQGTSMGIPTITRRDVEFIIELGRSFNDKPEEAAKVEYAKRAPSVGGQSPGDDYKDNAPLNDVLDLFTHSGWKVVKHGAGRILLRRPGARTKNHDADILVGKRVFQNYSPSVTEFDANKAYSFFAAYAILAHNSDFQAAARELRKQGYGDDAIVATAPGRDYSDASIPTLEPVVDTSLMDKIMASRIRLTDEKPNLSVVLKRIEKGPFPHSPVQEYPVAGHGMIGLVSGPAKSRKSAVVAAIEASALDGQEHCGFLMDIPEGDIVHIDTEQPAFWTYAGLARIAEQTGFDTLPERYAYYSLRRCSIAERFQSLEVLLRLHPNVKLLVIDGLKDMAADFVHDNKEADRIWQQIMRISEEHPSKPQIICVLHVNPDSEKMRGHLGTEASNKCDWTLYCKLGEQDDYTEAKFKECRFKKPPPLTALANESNILEVYEKAKHKGLQSDGSFGQESPWLPTGQYEQVRTSRREPDFL